MPASPDGYSTVNVQLVIAIYDSILSCTWEKLKEEDNFFELYKIIGKSQIN